MKKPTINTDLRIVDQSRTMSAFEVDFACQEARITIHFEQTSESPSAWRVKAKSRSRVGADPTTATSTAPTKLDALRATAAEWRSGPDDPSFDWEAMESLLNTVRAL